MGVFEFVISQIYDEVFTVEYPLLSEKVDIALFVTFIFWNLKSEYATAIRVPSGLQFIFVA